MGLCYKLSGRYEEAVKSYGQAIRLRPADPDVHNNLCLVYNMQGRYEEAVGSCLQAIRLKPDLAEAHNNLCWSYQRLKRYPEALAKSRDYLKECYAKAVPA